MIVSEKFCRSLYPGMRPFRLEASCHGSARVYQIRIEWSTRVVVRFQKPRRRKRRRRVSRHHRRHRNQRTERIGSYSTQGGPRAGIPNVPKCLPSGLTMMCRSPGRCLRMISASSSGPGDPMLHVSIAKAYHTTSTRSGPMDKLRVKQHVHFKAELVLEVVSEAVPHWLFQE